MSNIKINDVPQRIQYAATGGQTQFTVPFPFFQNNYIYVWLNGIQIFQGGAPGQYTVTGAGSPSGGLVTFNTAATLNDIVTIEGIMPIDRTSIYSATISNLTGSDLNGDFNREVVMLQQLNTVQSFMQLQYAPWAEVSQDLTVTKDRYIPLLLPNQVWAMNDAGTEIIGYDVPSSGGIAPDDATYLLQVADAALPNAQAMGSLASGLVVSTTTTGVQLTRSLAGTAGQIGIVDPTGLAGNPTFRIIDNPVLPGTVGMGIPSGTTAQRVTPSAPSIGLRFNTDLGQIEAYIGAQWVAIPSSAAGLFLPLAGGTMSGAIDMGAELINNLLDPVSAQDAATKMYVDTVVGGAAGGVAGNIQWNDGGAFGGDPNFNTDGAGNITIDGSLEVDNLSFNGNRISATTGLVELEDAQLFNDLDANSNKIINLAAPTSGGDATNKTYVDSVAAGFYFLEPVMVASTANFTSTYANGTAGVGATLTASVNGAASIDGVSLALTNRVLFKNQTNTFENGIYTVTQVGDGGTPAIYTRATDYDEPSDIDPGDMVPVLQGTVNASSFWVETATVTTIGTDPITFTQFGVSAANVVTITGSQTVTGQKTFVAPILGAASATSLAFTSTSGIIGTTTNDSAAAGSVGEYVTSVVNGSPVSISTNTATNLISISLTAGDWDVWGNLYFGGAVNTVVKSMNSWISTTSATLPFNYITQRQDYGSTGVANVAGGGVTMSMAVAPLRFSLSATTTIYLSGYAIFTTSTLGMEGYLSARRRR